ncbi:MAG: hypothetical protein FWB91_09685, partial [Defluviitaleaceae bacterium]|nr:hypothetical protein [Defluviitaleaceae bacterium]
MELTTSALGKSMNYLFSTWLPKHNLSTQPFSAEKYITISPEICKMELWVIPVAFSQGLCGSFPNQLKQRQRSYIKVLVLRVEKPALPYMVCL